jgi:hypothetical protein
MGLDKPGSDLFNEEIVKRSSTKTEFMKGAVSEKEECTSVAWSTKCTGVWIGLIVLWHAMTVWIAAMTIYDLLQETVQST